MFKLSNTMAQLLTKDNSVQTLYGSTIDHELGMTLA